jgi:hypothetical protein
MNNELEKSAQDQWFSAYRMAIYYCQQICSYDPRI